MSDNLIPDEMVTFVPHNHDFECPNCGEEGTVATNTSRMHCPKCGRQMNLEDLGDGDA